MLPDKKGVCVSSGSAYTSGSLETSHVLLAIGRPYRIAQGSLRLTISEATTAEEVDYLISAVRETVEYLRSISLDGREMEKRG